MVRRAIILILTSCLGVTPQAAQERADQDGQMPERTPESKLVVRISSGLSVMKVLVQVPRHEYNRFLRVVVQSGTFYASSDVQLDGRRAPRSHDLLFKNLSTGNYCVEVAVYGTSRSLARLRHPYRIVSAGPTVPLDVWEASMKRAPIDLHAPWSGFDAPRPTIDEPGMFEENYCIDSVGT